MRRNEQIDRLYMFNASLPLFYPVDSLACEEKVHFNTFLRSAGQALLGRLQEAVGLSEQRPTELLQQAGSLDVYLTVKSHRAALLLGSHSWTL